MRENRKVAAFIISVLILSALGVYLVQGSGGNPTANTHVISIDKVAIDQVDSPAGATIYMIFTNELNSGSETWYLNSTSFQVMSNASLTYSGTSAPFSGTNGSAAVRAGQSKSVQLFFQLPKDQRPVRLLYGDQTTKTRSDLALPSPSSRVSKFNLISDVTKVGSGKYVAGIIGYTLALNSTYASFIGDYVSYRSFSGDRLAVSITLQYYKQPSDPESIMVSSVTNTDGFSVVSVNPSLPVTMTGWGSKAAIQVTVLVPNESYSGGLHFVVGFNSSTP
ncbi:MAG: DUF4352 domain-containing protein [Nitrososphaerales archaeon]|nr:DUF4352 domain-containing protein [Nitrososphaerales archaeon]